MTDLATPGRSKRDQHRGWRILVAIACLGYAAMAVVAGLDRITMMDLGRSAPIAWPYAVAGPFNAANAAIKRHDPASAIAYAKLVVQRDPVDAYAVGLLGKSYILANQPEAARKVFAIGERLGWRDRATQRYWLVEALQLGDARRAARHLDAELRMAPDVSDQNDLFRLILQYDEGRAALAAQLANNPDWLVTFVANVDRLDEDDLDARADVVQRTGEGHWQCPQAANLIDALLSKGLLDDAGAVHRTVCTGASGTGAESIVNDSDFSRLAAGTGTSALDWNLLRRGDLVVNVNPLTPRGYELEMANTSASTVLVAWQVIIARPGHYRATWRMPDTVAKDAAALAVSFDCSGNFDLAINGTHRPGTGPGYQADFVIPDTCPTPTLRLWLSPNHPVNLTGVQLTRLDPARSADR